MEEIGSDELPIVEREVTEEIESVSQDREDYNEGVPGQVWTKYQVLLLYFDDMSPKIGQRECFTF